MAGHFHQLEEVAQDAGLKGCPMRDAIKNIPWREQLEAVRELQQHPEINPGLDINIKAGSVPTNFEYSIYSHGPSPTEIKQLAEILDTTPAQLQEKFDKTLKGMPPMLLLHEKVDAQDSSTSTTIHAKAECYGP
jgi:hypothetical protein